MTSLGTANMTFKSYYKRPDINLDNAEKLDDDGKKGDPWFDHPEDWAAKDPSATSWRQVAQFVCKRRNPHGFWSIHASDDGYIPDALKDTYTGHTELAKAIKNWNEKNTLRMQIRKVELLTEEGRVIARVPLGPKSEVFAEILHEDYLFLLKLGVSANWNKLPLGYVTAAAYKASGGHVMVARVLLDAGAGENVSYKDGNRLNLRRENLSLVKTGIGIRRDRDLLTKRAA